MLYLARLIAALLTIVGPAAAQQSTPRHAVVASWPKPLPENMILGQVSGIAVGKNDTIWILHRPSTLVDDE